MGGLDLVSSLVKVALVFGLLFVTMRVLAKTQGGRNRGRSRPGSRSALIEILDESRLGRSATVAAVRVGNRAFLLGVTEDQVATLADLTDDIDLTEPEDATSEVERLSVLDHAVDLLKSGSFRR